VSELEEVRFRALRRPEKGAYERHLALKLLTANAAAPLKRILKICEAARYLHPERAKQLGLALEQIDKVFQVALSLNNVVVYGSVYSIAWCFPQNEESFKHYIKPWITNCSYHTHLIVKHRVNLKRVYCHAYLGNLEHCNHLLGEIPAELNAWKWVLENYGGKKEYGLRYARCPKCKSKIGKYDIRVVRVSYLKPEPLWSFFFEASQVLTPLGYQTLLNSFIAWTSPFIDSLERLLANEVTPEVWREIQAQANTISEGEAADENTVGPGQP